MITKNSYITRILFLFFIFFSPTTAQDSLVSISGSVIDIDTREPIPAVNIIFKGTRYGAATDKEGKFSLQNVPAKQYTLEFSHINYIPVSYTRMFFPGIASEITIEMKSRAIILEKVEVIGIPEGRFLPGAPTGYVIRRDEIQHSGAITFGDVIRRFIPRSRIREEAGDLYIHLHLRNTILQSPYLVDPYPLIILDGMHLGTSPIGLANVVSPSDIAFVHVLRPPDSESLYGPTAKHGAIIIETINRTDDKVSMKPFVKRLIIGGIVSIIFYLAFLR